MDLQKITIENFKCFQSQNEIEFGQLTLLTGANSSGKSSIIYSILGAIQSGEFPFQFSTNGKYVNMGDFKEIIYNHNRKGKIKLGFEFKNGSIHKIETVWGENLVNNLPKLFELNANSDYFDLSLKLKGQKYVVDFSYDPKKDPSNNLISKEFFKKLNNLIIDTSKNESTESKVKKSNQIDISDYFEELNKAQNIKGLVLDEIPFFDGKQKEKGTIKLRQTIEIIFNIFTNYDEHINFISSFRLHPDRTYLEQTKSKLKVNNFGDGYLDQIIYWETKNKTKFKQLIKTLKELRLLESIKSKRLEGGRFEISVQIKKNGIDTSLSDVGFGISQFLPIIVADLQLPKSSTLFIAQPEIHLHPSVQSSFGVYLTNQIKVNSKNYVIETHSEYLLNRIRLAVVKGEIKEEEVKVIFVDNESEDNTIHKIKFNKKGQILGAPSNFFKTYMMDVMEIAIKAAN
ncbi:MAG: AAA family ATPase [Flavobacterium sp.]|nr:AAA family ATPase [Flavobacterium sp.]